MPSDPLSDFNTVSARQSQPKRRKPIPLKPRIEAMEFGLTALLRELDAEDIETGLVRIRALKQKEAASLPPAFLPNKSGLYGLSEASDTVPMDAFRPDSTPAAAERLDDPRAAVTRLRGFADKIAVLNGTIASMEEQLASLYSDRERLEHEIGASEVDDVIAVFRARQAVIDSMEEQLSCMYQDREVMDSALGRSDPQEIVSMFHTVSNLVNGAREQLQAA